jgi:hypothetical protein
MRKNYSPAQDSKILALTSAAAARVEPAPSHQEFREARYRLSNLHCLVFRKMAPAEARTIQFRSKGYRDERNAISVYHGEAVILNALSTPRGGNRRFARLTT